MELVELDSNFLESIDDWNNIEYDKNRFEPILYTVVKKRKKVGVVGYVIINSNCFLIVAIHQYYRGNGLLSEMVSCLVDKIKVSTLYATIDMENISSIKAHKKIGFTEIADYTRKQWINLGMVSPGMNVFYKRFR